MKREQTYDLTGKHLDDDGPQAHHEAITTCSAMTVNVHQIFVLRLFVNRCKMVFTSGETEILGAEESHWSRGSLFVTKIPTNNSSV